MYCISNYLKLKAIYFWSLFNHFLFTLVIRNIYGRNIEIIAFHNPQSNTFLDILFEPERTLPLSIYLSIEMAYGDENDFGWCNLFIKFALFVMNFLVWVNHYMYSTGREKVVFLWSGKLYIARKSA